MNQASFLGLNFDQLMVIDGSKFFTKILSVVDWSSLFLNFSQDLPGTVFEVSATALCVDKKFQIRLNTCGTVVFSGNDKKCGNNLIRALKKS